MKHSKSPAQRTLGQCSDQTRSHTQTHANTPGRGSGDTFYSKLTVQGDMFVFRPARLLQIALTFPSHEGAMLLSHLADGQDGMNCSEDTDFCTGTESLFFNLMQQISIFFTTGSMRGGDYHVCLLSVHFFLMFIYSACSRFNLTAALCHTGLISTVGFFLWQPLNCFTGAFEVKAQMQLEGRWRRFWMCFTFFA